MRVVFYDCSYSSLGVQYLITALRARGHEVVIFFDPSLSKGLPGTGHAFFPLKPSRVSWPYGPKSCAYQGNRIKTLTSP